MRHEESPAASSKKRGTVESSPHPVESYAALFDSSLYSSMKEGYLASKRARAAKASGALDAGPLWQGTLTLPTMMRVAASGWMHSFLGPRQSPSLLEELGLPADLVVKGRIEQSKGLEYLQQVLKSSTRCTAVLQVGRSPVLALPSPELPSAVHNKGESRAAAAVPLDSSETANLSLLYEHFASRRRWGVIYSNLGHSLPRARSAQWIIKDLYLIPIDKSEPRAVPLSTIDVDLLNSDPFGPEHGSPDAAQQQLYLVAVMGRPSVPAPLVKENFQYRSIDTMTRSASSSDSNDNRYNSSFSIAPVSRSARAESARDGRASRPASGDTEAPMSKPAVLPAAADFGSTLDSLSAVLGNTDSPLLNDISESIVSSKINPAAYP